MEAVNPEEAFHARTDHLHHPDFIDRRNLR